MPSPTRANRVRHHDVGAEDFRRFQEGDAQAMEVVVSLTYGRLVGYLRLFTRDIDAAEDVAQEVYLAAFRQRSKIAGPEKLRPWLFTVARRMVRRSMERQRRTAEMRFDESEANTHEPMVEARQMEALLSEDARRALEVALDSLSAQERELVSLRFFGGLAIKELSEAMEMPMGSVGVKLARSLVKLRHHLDSAGLRLGDFL